MPIRKDMTQKKLHNVADEYIDQIKVTTQIHRAVRDLEEHNRELIVKLSQAYEEIEEWQNSYYELLHEYEGYKDANNE